jgi:excisionase family DNA binding protein
MASSPEGPEWLRSPDAADYLGVGLRTLYKFIDDGDLPAYRMGRVIRLKRADVDAFIESRRIQPGTLDHLRADGGGGSADTADD